jgi:hypothetical protein
MILTGPKKPGMVTLVLQMVLNVILLKMIDIGILGKLRKFYTRLNNIQPLTRDRDTWEYWRDTLGLEVAQWTDQELNEAAARTDGRIGVKNGWECFIDNS